MADAHAAIRAEGLGKRYRISARADTRPRFRFPGRGRVPLWALRDVTFEVPRGSVLGVIGANGAGKTTLLKVLSRVTPPTEGRAVLAGKTSALLEVGTGFHPELTGRENIFLNGAILGMRRREIIRKFDEIVAFSELETFIDTPIKRYSSGMNLRLAFSVAAHLEPEILLVDEVLAVGDAAFQKKSLGKMEDVTHAGRTVVLVSHSMPTIASLADKCLWLDHGQVAAEGAPSEVIAKYLEGSTAPAGGAEADLTQIPRADYHHQEARFTRARLLDADGQPRTRFYEREPLVLEVEFEVTRALPILELRAYVKTIEGHWLFSSLSGRNDVDLGPGRYAASTTLDPNYLSPGRYRVDFTLGSGIPQDGAEDALRFEVEHSLEGHEDPTLRGDVGRLRLPYAWTPIRPVS